MRSSKKVNPNVWQEKSGLICLQEIVKELKCLWRPTPNDDHGIDGEVEIVIGDTPTDQLIKVQCKSGRSYIHNARFGRFDYYASEPDLKYWNGCNVPVILVIHDPDVGKLYWRHVQAYIRSNPSVWSKPHAIRFFSRSDVFDDRSYVKLCSLVITEEAELNDLLKDSVQETLRSNLLPAIETPKTLFHFSIAVKAASELSESGVSFPDRLFSKGEGGVFFTFQDPLVEGFAARAWLDQASVGSIDVCEFLREKRGQRVIVELSNKALAVDLQSRGLLQREKGHRFFFPPGEGPKAREMTWQTPFRQASRKVAYPYVSKKTGQTAFWVHHSLRVWFKALQSQWMLQLEPGYVFTRDGATFVASEHVGRLTTKKISYERNQQVLNHLLFWAWFLDRGEGWIAIPCAEQRYLFENSYVGGRTSFGIPTDRKRLTELIEASPDIDWEELERGLPDETPERERT